MVLWELTVATAYFLGLKRTYRLALKIQRRLISPKYLKSRQFLQRRTRAVFDVAINVVHNIQQRDIEAGRNLGNLILRWLDRMKPSANIHGISCEKPTAPNSINLTKPTANRQPETPRSLVRSNARSLAQGSDRNLFSTTTNTWPKSIPTIAMMLQSARPAGSTSQLRHLCINGAQVLRSSYGRPVGFDGVIRKDILEWMNGY
ncbi:hypothetical protein Nepgr_030645 [Nepenthes gracilis]|uniref:Uncharacterized protein n=1 Tax=Nepenthes gracilis TaxID=150966 RepID=A0AAD3THD5_NEPGR|nr:hypothetical protein Nepgr_030645 [Nepenthes gracilis]